MGHEDEASTGERPTGASAPIEPTAVTLTIGAVHREVRVARLVAAGVAALAAFDLESTEDLRIAVDEACVWLIEHGDGSALRLAFVTAEQGRVKVTGETRHGGGVADGELTGLAAQILAASCEQHSFEALDGTARFTLTAAALETIGASGDAGRLGAPETT